MKSSEAQATAVVSPMPKKALYERLRMELEPYTYDSHANPEAFRSFSVSMAEYVDGGLYGLWLSPDSEDGHCDPEELAYRLADRYVALAELPKIHMITSPIEAMLSGALLWLEIDWAGFPTPKQFSDPNSARHGCAEFFICPQAKISKFTVDFALWFEVGKLRAGIVIECDGHDFHERTKEQASKDKKRDRDLLSRGYPVVRFTGSEIFKDPQSCADQISGTLSNILQRVSKDGGLF